MLRTYAVFNENQIDGLTIQNTDFVSIVSDDANNLSSRRFIEATKATIEIGGRPIHEAVLHYGQSLREDRLASQHHIRRTASE